jgi:hypothetical protein
VIELPGEVSFSDDFKHGGQFGRNSDSIYFPLWYPTLVFALAAVAAIRVGRRFTLRSTLIATAIVAALLGMVAAL